MVVCGIYPSLDGPLPRYESNTAAIYPRNGRLCRRLGHVIYNPVLKIRCCGDIRLSEYHHVESSAFYLPDDMRQNKALAILDVQRPDGKPGWALGSEARRQRRRVQGVSAMGDLSEKGEWHPCRKPKNEKGRVKKPRIGFSRTYGP